MAFPWGTLGSKFEEYLSELNAQVESLHYFEIIVYPNEMVVEDEFPRPYYLHWGEPDQQAPSTSAFDEAPEDEEVVKRGVDELLAGMRDDLKAALSEISSEEFHVGIRAAVTSANPGYSCSGIWCVYRFSMREWWLLEYFTRNERCHWRWVEPC